MGIGDGFGDCCIHDTVRFLPSQEWSSGENGNLGRIWRLLAARHCEILAFAGMVCEENGNRGQIWRLLHTRHCEIPAFAGMVFGENGNRGRIWRLLHTRHCEIPAFAGMVFGENGNRGRILGIVVHPPRRIAAAARLSLPNCRIRPIVARTVAKSATQLSPLPRQNPPTALHNCKKFFHNLALSGIIF